MATATRITEERVIEEASGVRLELTEIEAQTLADVLALVGGCPDRSRRKHAGTVLTALYGAGVRYQAARGIGFDHRDRDTTGFIHFEDRQ